MMQSHTQAGNITTNSKVKVDFTLTALSAMNVVTWKCHVNDSAKGRYNMILGRDILTELGLNLKLSEHAIKADDGTFKGYTTPMIDLVICVFKYLNTGKRTPKESFTNANTREVYESEHVRTTTKQLRVILDAKYEMEDLHKVMETQCQNLTITQRD